MRKVIFSLLLSSVGLFAIESFKPTIIDYIKLLQTDLIEVPTPKDKQTITIAGREFKKPKAPIYFLKCVFNRYSTPEGLKYLKKKELFNLTFIVEDEARYGYVFGNKIGHFFSTITATEVFLEVTEAYNIMTTSISVSKGIAVHSRNTAVPYKLIPSQYYGKCKLAVIK